MGSSVCFNSNVFLIVIVVIIGLVVAWGIWRTVNSNKSGNTNINGQDVVNAFNANAGTTQQVANTDNTTQDTNKDLSEKSGHGKGHDHGKSCDSDMCTYASYDNKLLDVTHHSNYFNHNYDFYLEPHGNKHHEDQTGHGYRHHMSDIYYPEHHPQYHDYVDMHKSCEAKKCIHSHGHCPRNYINIPTRGHPYQYRLVGNLIRLSDEKIIKLFGKPKQRGSYRWEYYGVITGNDGQETKIQIDIPSNRELDDKEEINLDFADPNKGKFTVFLHDFDRPRYDPYIGW